MSTPAKKRAASKKVASHPPYSAMIKAAVKNLKERGGSSKIAIQKYILAHYKFDKVDAVPGRLRLALRKACDNGIIKHAKGGVGASGSFKLADKVEKPKAAKKPRSKSPKKKKAAPKKAAASGAAAPAAKKASKPKKAKSPKKAKKPAAAKKPKAAKKPAAKKTKSPKKAKKPAKK